MIGIPIEDYAKSRSSSDSVIPRFSLPSVTMRLRNNTNSSLFGIIIEWSFADADDVLLCSWAYVNALNGIDIPTVDVQMELAVNI